MTRSEPKIVAGIGELLWDCFPARELPGGAPANVAFHAGQLGLRGVICSRVGGDDAGGKLLEELRRRGLSTQWVQVDEQLPTGRVTVDTGNPAHPSYRIHRNVAWDAIRFDDSLSELVQSAAAVCVGSLAQRSQQSRETILSCLGATPALRVFDVNLRGEFYRKEWIEQTLRRVQIVKLNTDEVSVLFPMLGLPPDPTAFGRGLIEEYGVEWVCVTRAEAGCLLLTEDETVDIPGKTVAVADAVGAGDAFTAALISSRLRGWALDRAGRLANDLGGLVASRDGAMPDLKAEIAELLSEKPVAPGS